MPAYGKITWKIQSPTKFSKCNIQENNYFWSGKSQDKVRKKSGFSILKIAREPCIVSLLLILSIFEGIYIGYTYILKNIILMLEGV